MTKEEKAGIAAFLDLAGDYLSGGYRKPRGAYAFTDDAEQERTEQQVLARTEQVQGADSLEKIARDAAACGLCKLCSTRTNAVPGEGVPRPLVMVIGEGPGADEDASGRPFVGRAGQLLDRMLDSKGKIGLSRNKNCYIANVVKCRPPGNRNPEGDEIAACAPFLRRQIAVLKPLVILSAGSVATRALLDTTEGITKLRGQFTSFTLDHTASALFEQTGMNIPLLPTFHPSALLRDESLKAPVWEDLKKLRAKLCGLNAEYAAEMAAAPL